MVNFFLNLKLKQKMIFLVLSAIALIFIFVLGYLAINSRTNEIISAKRLLESNSQNYANTFSEYINYSMDITRSLAHTSEALIESGNPDRLILDKTLAKTIEANPDFLAVWTRWEPEGFDKADSIYAGSNFGTQSGIFDLNYYYSNGEIVRYVDMTTPPEEEVEIEYGPYITIPKATLQEAIIDPYYYSFTGQAEDEILMTTTAVPVVIDGEYRGVLAIDIELESLYDIISGMQFYNSGFGKIVSNSGQIVAHPNINNIGRTAYEFVYYDMQAIEYIQQGINATAIGYSEDLGEETLKIYTPISVGDTPTPWSFIIEVPMSEIKSVANRQFYIIIFLGLAALSIVIFVIIRIANYIANPVNKATSVLKTLATGNLEDVKSLKVSKGSDEMTEMAIATNTLVKGLKDTVSFAQDIEQGKLDTEYSLLSDNDQLGKALLNMRKGLVEAEKENQKRKEEDQKRNWATEGYAKFGEILRIDNDDLESLSFKVIQNLVHYLGANQGGIFVLNDSDEEKKILEMTACFAFDRQKFLEKRIEIGEGLIGACYKEGKTIYMTDIPESYTKIMSGLGYEDAKALLIVPLNLNDEIYGVIELASFEPFEKHHIEFVEKVGESVASTISNIKTNIHTNNLLEQSQKQAEEMKAQEEEMRQNMEELAATQEEMERKEKQLAKELETSNEFLAMLQYDEHGIIEKTNNIFNSISKYAEGELIGKHHGILFDNKNFRESAGYKKFWEDMNNGITIKSVFKKIAKDGSEFLVKGLAKPEFDEQGNLKHVIEVYVDITQELLKSG